MPDKTPAPTQCLDEGTLRAYLDGELPAAEQAAIEAHLHDCQPCTAALAALETQADLVYGAMGRIPVPAPSTRTAWNRFEARQRSLADASLIWRIKTMWHIITNRHWRPALTGTAIALLLVTVMAVTPLRTAAARFLSVFRIQKIAVIQFDPKQANQLGNYQEQIFGQPQVDKVERVDVKDTAEASKLTGFAVLTPSRLPKGIEERTLFRVENARSAHTEVNLAAARGLFEAAGLPTDAIPAGQDTLQVNAKIPAGVEMRYGQGANTVTIVQARSPQVDVPAGFDLARLGEMGLRLLGLPADQAARLSHSIDWATTLVIPVPSDLGMVQEVTVRQTKGYLLQTTDKANNMEKSGTSQKMRTVVFWQNGDILYAVGGNLSSSRLLDIADSLQ